MAELHVLVSVIVDLVGDLMSSGLTTAQNFGIMARTGSCYCLSPHCWMELAACLGIANRNGSKVHIFTVRDGDSFSSPASYMTAQ